MQMKNTSTKRTQSFGFWVMLVLSVLMALGATAPYMNFNPDTFNDFLRPGFLQALPWVYVHIIGAFIALLVGPFQFIKGLRDRHPMLHRWIGRLYLVAGIGVGGLGGIIISFHSPAGLVGTFGFTMLALAWWYTGWEAYRTIRAGRVQEHKMWMIRNYALTFAAVTLRLWLGVLVPLVMFQMPTPDLDAAILEAYRVVPFMCWVPNLIVAEVIINRMQKQTTGEKRAVA